MGGGSTPGASLVLRWLDARFDTVSWPILPIFTVLPVPLPVAPLGLSPLTFFTTQKNRRNAEE